MWITRQRRALLYRTTSYLPSCGKGLRQVKKHDEAFIQKPCKQSFYDGAGSRVGRTSSDTVWPLRRADGSRWSDSQKVSRR